MTTGCGGTPVAAGAEACTGWPCRGRLSLAMSAPARLLKLILRVQGLILLLALPAAFFPRAWMDQGHRMLGMGALPEGPLVEYLARSISLLYAVHGGLAIMAASDLRRHGALIRYLAGTGLCFGLGMIAIDLSAGMPWYWTAAEGPGIVAAAVVILALQARLRL